jgi:hypothetical protein
MSYTEYDEYLYKRDSREPFPEQDYLDECDTCNGTPHSHVCRKCHQSISSAACDAFNGLCRNCYNKGGS